MHKIRTLTDLRKLMLMERFDRKNTRVFVKIDDSVIPITGVELDVDGTDAGKMAVYFIVDDGAEVNENG